MHQLDLPTTTLLETKLEGYPLWRRGKVRDVFDLGERLLVIATDRLSAFDVVLPTGIPGKGAVLTALSNFWFGVLGDVVPNHIATGSGAIYPEDLRSQSAAWDQRAMLVVKTEPLPIECVVRGYLAGSGYKDYLATGSVCGVKLPAGLRESERLPEPIFTPATKAASGHDENIDFARTVSIVGEQWAEQVRTTSLELYRRAARHAELRGILLADTKFEFGVWKGQLVWIDEALTPDSSRFWPAAGYAPGHGQPSFDKQYVRDYLETLAWDKQPPGPALPADVVTQTRARYVEALLRLTAAVGAEPTSSRAPR